MIPLLGAPMAGASDRLLGQAVEAAAARGLVGPNDHVVCADIANLCLLPAAFISRATALPGKDPSS